MFNSIAVWKKTVWSSLLMSMFGLQGCSWVKPVSGADQVQLVTLEALLPCEKVGSVNTSVAAKVGFIERSDNAVSEDSVILAKNEAVRMGANRIVAVELPQEGRMRFDLYRCR